MLLYNPAYAQPVYVANSPATAGYSAPIPVTYVESSDADQLFSELKRQGYTIQEGTFVLLEQLTQADDTGQLPKKTSSTNTKNTDNNKGQPSCDEKTSTDNLNCKQDNPQSQLPGNDTQGPPEIIPPPGPNGPPAPQPQPAQTVQPHVSIEGNVSYGHSGGNGDAGKVFFLLIGVVVVAAFIVYAGKFVSDLVTNKEAKLWWEIIANSNFMDTNSGQHGDFYGVKLATGIVSSELFQLALIGEIGNADINLIINETTDPQVLDFSASYWMLGGAVRMHLTDKLVNASYLYLELMGGTTNDPVTDIIGAARMGASFGINDTIRLGGNIGAQYIGLNKDQGFRNTDNNYWYTVGLELGVRF